MLCGAGVRVSVGDGLVEMAPAVGLMLLNLYLLVAASR
jgi:hypothetical protein